MQVTGKLERDVCEALARNNFKVLSSKPHYIANARAGLYIGEGPDPDRFSQALLVLKAQSLGDYHGKVAFVNSENKFPWKLVRGAVCVYTSDEAEGTDILESSNKDSE
uniref:Uncharacterized protein n=1 Tax=Aureoumbra lagunensis TaxID=44058 RepID=A0A7S3JZV8_9STRA|mmetsp:Transcript_1909/g.2529  ORF Transcript_1909/g.2529 Transcript_1909/m.2529 type:complete len:108 (-) Transcript_1909:217-540(-)